MSLGKQCAMVTVTDPDLVDHVRNIIPPGAADACPREATVWVETGDSRPLPMCDEHGREMREALAFRDKQQQKRRRRQ